MFDLYRVHFDAKLLHTNAHIVDIDIRGQETETVSPGKILTEDEVNAINTFDNPRQISLENFKDFELTDNKLMLTLPSKSLVMVPIE